MNYIYIHTFVEVFGTAKHFQIFFQGLWEASPQNIWTQLVEAHVWRRSSPERGRTYFHGVARQRARQCQQKYGQGGGSVSWR